MATNFVAYFTSWAALLPGLLHEPSKWSGALFAIALVAGAIVDFGWFRDQMCTIACPYGRPAERAVDPNTLLVAMTRRARRTANAVAGLLPWRRCVRRLQCRCERVSDRCGYSPRPGSNASAPRCVDACDEVMRKLGRPTGLIKFTSRWKKGKAQRLWNRATSPTWR